MLPRADLVPCVSLSHTIRGVPVCRRCLAARYTYGSANISNEYPVFSLNASQVRAGTWANKYITPRGSMIGGHKTDEWRLWAMAVVQVAVSAMKKFRMTPGLS